MKGKIVKLFKALLTLTFFLFALAALGLVFWIKIKPWVYSDWFLGADTSQYIYYVFYYLKHPHFPVNGWDYFWHNGVPRVIDLTWLHFTLNANLAYFIGFYQSIKLYPLIYLGIFVFFSYLLFWDLSGSILIALGLAVSLTWGEAIYTDLFSAGVVLSSISHTFLPMTLFFLVRFYKTKMKPFLFVGGVTTALGLYSHGLMGMFWVFIPSFLFLLLATRSWRQLINKESMVNAVIFTVVTLSVGALASWLHILQALGGGSNALMFERVNAVVNSAVFQQMWNLNDWGVVFAFVGSILVAWGFWFLKKTGPSRLLGAFGGVLIFYLLWLLSYRLGINPLVGVIFPGRIYWVWSVLLGSMTAILLSPLAKGKLFSSNFIKLGIFSLAISSLLFSGQNFDYFRKNINLLTTIDDIKKINVVQHYYEINQVFLSLIENSKETNVRLWTHIPVINLGWNFNSDIPLSEGYAHVWTKYSRGWEGWIFAILAEPNWATQEVPREMTRGQAKFFLDWYGIKYLIGNVKPGENAVSPLFSQEGECVSGRKENNNPDITTIYKIDDNCTSGIVSVVKSPVVGFIGGDEGYKNFIKDIATLNLNTSRLIPVKISEAISDLSSQNLDSINALVIYEFKKGNSLFYGSGWSKVLDFVKNGGRVWIETGGNAVERENNHLPEIFPIAANKFGSLDRNWQPGGILANAIDFSLLGKLDYFGQPWQVSYAQETKTKPNAQVLLTQKNYSVAVAQNLGKGKVIWTGLNVFYRPEYFRKTESAMNEVRLMELFLKDLMGDLPAQKATAKISRPTPEKITVEGENFSGVVLKETNWPGWQAKVTALGKTTNLPIFTAGPELMYINIPKDLRKGEIKVFFNYQGPFIYWLSFFVSLFSGLAVIFYLLFGGIISRFFGPKIK